MRLVGVRPVRGSVAVWSAGSSDYFGEQPTAAAVIGVSRSSGLLRWSTPHVARIALVKSLPLSLGLLAVLADRAYSPRVVIIVATFWRSGPRRCGCRRRLITVVVLVLP